MGPADLFSSFGGSMIPPVEDWSLGLDSGNSIINDVDWSLPGFNGVGDFVFENNIRNGHLDVSDILPGCEPSPDFLFNHQLPGSQIPSGSDAGRSDQSYSPPAMPPKSPSSQGPSSSKSQRRSPSVDPTTALKRQRNNVAARKYRQKRIDRISELETELRDVKQERDDLRLRLARQEAEAAALRSMLQLNPRGGAKG
ncbi:hypothetical protein F4804DRAFT_328268 [Jackrogersella minutella]|nr:hypothetical protein F4804DRAFT_328268 [Jackrogersella minutella]